MQNYTVLSKQVKIEIVHSKEINNRVTSQS